MRSEIYDTIRHSTLKLAVLLACIFLAALLSACGTAPTALPATTSPTPLISGAVSPEGTSTPSSSSGIPEGISTTLNGTTTPQVTPTSTDDLSAKLEAGSAVAARTPLPTPIPGILDIKVEQLTDELGLSDQTFLGVTVYSWINLIISGLIIFLGYLAIDLLVRTLFNRLVKRSNFQFDDQLLSTIENPLKWLIVAVITRFAILRLAGVNAGLRTFLDDVFFVVILILTSIIGVRLIRVFAKWYIGRLKPGEDSRSLTPAVTIIQRIGYFFLIIFAVSIGLDHFGLDITVLAVLMLVAGGLIALGARDTVENTVNGFLILLDQPFRVGDDIYIKDLDTWGDVLEIGTRSTRIRTRDNREVIVPNAKIAQSLVTNFSFPDPRFRVETKLGVAYGSDFEQVRKVITDAVRKVDGVLPEKPVNIYFSAFGDSARQMKVRFWVASRANMNPVLDRVNEALELALAQAGIVLPNNTMDLNVNLNSPQEASADASEQEGN